MANCKLPRKSRNGTRSYNCRSFPETNGILEELNTLIIRCKHPHVQCHCSYYSRPSTFPKRQNPFVCNNTIKCMEGICVMSALMKR
uniref:Uncharacterized protein n=1 Tax=Lotus japonicus TaxID=34305 RepID=I3S7M9_LOTJA|nr:unknown [Lotus japonicus]